VHGRRSLVLACAAPLLFAAAVGAQGRATRGQEPVRGWELPGLDIRSNGGWRVRARAVAAARARMLEQRNFPLLNAAPLPAGAAAINAVTGVLRVPVIMFRYQDSPPSQYSRDTAAYNATLFAPLPPGGKPYTLRTYYEQLSNGLFSIQGAAVGWVALAGAETTYTGAPGACPSNPYGTKNCNGLFGGAFALMQAGLVEAVQHADSQIDFGQFDNDGPDGIPNSGDDDGVVDAVLFVHPSMDGACLSPGNNHLWSHRSSIFVQTSDSAHNGGKILVEDYILQSGLGSPLADGSPCDSTAIMPIGTAAHELGHILALPDLYDIQGSTEGIGEYGLMGSGNYKTGNSPARYDAWSLQQMGWTTVEPIAGSGRYTVGPVPTADTVFYVNVQGSNPRSEYYLIENRQEVQADSAMLRSHCDRSNNPPGCGGGLLIYHVDGDKACLINVCANTMNAGSIHGLVVEEADGLRQLWNDVNGDNRGDGGDPYPGTTGNTAFSFDSKPAAIKNVDSSFVGFTVDSISQVVPNGAMAFRLRFGGLTVVQASDTAALIVVDGDSQHVFRNMLEDGSSHTIAVADTQLTADARSRFVFQSWSDGGAISHSVTGSVAGATYTAALAAEHRLSVTVLGSGTVSYNPAADSNGVLVAQGTPVALTATAAPPFAFGGWFGDTTASTPVLMLPMGRPFDLTVRFDPVLAIASGDPRPGGIMGKAYVDTLHATGGTGNYSWQLVQDSLPPGLTFAVTGRISGTPRQTGTWTFTVRATSGAQQVLRQLSMTIRAPTLAASAVVAQLLTGASTLSSDDVNYLQLLGNKDGLFDVGDFLAWVRASGATPVPPTAPRSGGGRQP
jgi:M6 family metalloprotease-like protein